MEINYYLCTDKNKNTINLTNLPDLIVINKTIKKEQNKKISDFYKSQINWEANPSDRNNEFIYITDNSNQILGIVRINHTGKELDYGLVNQSQRGKKLYEPLCKKRVQYLIDNYEGVYVLYTEHDHLINMHKRTGLTLINPSGKERIQGSQDQKEYWKFEINRPVNDLIVTLKYNFGICSGIQISPDTIYTAAHCVKHPDRMNLHQNDDPKEIIYNNGTKTNPTQTSHFNYNIPARDAAIVKTQKIQSASNVYILTNPECLPDNFSLLCYGKNSCSVKLCKTTKQKVEYDLVEPKEGEDIKLKISKEIEKFTNEMRNKVPDFHLSRFVNIHDLKQKYNNIIGEQVNTMNEVIDSLFKYYTFYKINRNLQQGDSGGSFGFYFGYNCKNFALVGSVSETGSFFLNVAPFIDDILRDTSINLVTYDKKKNKLIIPNTNIYYPFNEKWEQNITKTIPNTNIYYSLNLEQDITKTKQTTSLYNYLDKLKPNTKILLATIIPYLIYKSNEKTIDNFEWKKKGLKMLLLND